MRAQIVKFEGCLIITQLWTAESDHKKVSETILDIALYCLKKFPSKSDLSLLKVISIHIFSQHILQSIKIQPLYMYCPLLDKKKLWQAFTTDMYMYICTLCWKNEQSIIEICKKNSEILHCFIFLHYKSKKNETNLFFWDCSSNLSNIWIIFCKVSLYIFINQQGKLHFIKQNQCKL